VDKLLCAFARILIEHSEIAGLSFSRKFTGNSMAFVAKHQKALSHKIYTFAQ
jgi:hypothetical protein